MESGLLLQLMGLAPTTRPASPLYWVDQDDQATIDTKCQWSKNQNFIIRSFQISIANEINLSGMQFIGWDPSEQKIRSWVFDSDGGFGHAIWAKRENRWVISAVATLPDGRKSTSVNIITPLDQDSMTWQATGREVDGEILPNIAAVTVKRVTEAK